MGTAYDNDTTSSIASVGGSVDHLKDPNDRAAASRQSLDGVIGARHHDKKKHEAFLRVIEAAQNFDADAHLYQPTVRAVHEEQRAGLVDRYGTALTAVTLFELAIELQDRNQEVPAFMQNIIAANTPDGFEAPSIEIDDAA